MSEISYQEAVDKVCLECEFGNGNSGNCATCPVRHMKIVKKEPRFNDKKANMEYWDDIESRVKDSILWLEAMAANTRIKEISEEERLDVVKKATETIIENLTYYGLVFPYVEGEA